MTGNFISAVTGQPLPMVAVREVIKIKLASGEVVPVVSWEEEAGVGGGSVARFAPPMGKMRMKHKGPWVMWTPDHPGHYHRGRAVLADGRLIEGVRPKTATVQDIAAVKKKYRPEVERCHMMAYECDLSVW